MFFFTSFALLTTILWGFCRRTWFYTRFKCVCVVFHSCICRCVLLSVSCVSFLIHFCAFIAMHWLDFSFSFVICFIHRQNVQAFLFVVYRHKTFHSHSLTLHASFRPESSWHIYIYIYSRFVYGDRKTALIADFHLTHHRDRFVPFHFVVCWFAWNSTYRFRCIKHLWLCDVNVQSFLWRVDPLTSKILFIIFLVELFPLIFFAPFVVFQMYCRHIFFFFWLILISLRFVCVFVICVWFSCAFYLIFYLTEDWVASLL